MNEQRVVGLAHDQVGKVEWAVGDAIGNSEMQADGVINRVAGVFEQGFGVARDAADDAVEAAPARIRLMRDRGVQLGRDANERISNRLGDKGALYLLASVVGLLGVGFVTFAVSRASRVRSERRTGRKPAVTKRTSRTAPIRRRTAEPAAA